MLRNTLKLFSYFLVMTGVFSAYAGSFDDFFKAINIDDARGVQRLLDRGFDPNAVNDKGLPALLVALRDDSGKVTDVLVNAPSLQLEATSPADETALMMAALKGKADVARRLLERGARINRPGWTPLHYAASGPALQLVALFVERGAVIDALAANGNTPLMMAARYGDQRSAELLLAQGANPKLRNKAGLSAADFARTEGRDRLADKLESAAR